jgi:hypothetical protein
MKRSLLHSVVLAARAVAARQLDEAAAGSGSKTTAFLAVLTLEAAHAMLKLHPSTARDLGDVAAPVLDRAEPELASRVEVQLSPMPDVYFTVLPERSEHGPN